MSATIPTSWSAATSTIIITASSTDPPELGSYHHPDNQPNIGALELKPHRHPDLIANHRHANRLTHLEPNLRGPGSLADGTTHHRQPHGLADGIANHIGPDRHAYGVVEHLSPESEPELDPHHHPDNQPYIGPIESKTHRHPIQTPTTAIPTGSPTPPNLLPIP